jgi:hypothetical protein
MSAMQRINDSVLGPLERPALAWLARRIPQKIVPVYALFCGQDCRAAAHPDVASVDAATNAQLGSSQKSDPWIALSARLKSVSGVEKFGPRSGRCSN